MPKRFLCQKNFTLTLGQMLNLIYLSSLNESESNYAAGLRKFVFKHSCDKWNIAIFYGKKDEEFYKDYPKKYRNDAHHNRIYDRKLTEECKKDTLELLTWFTNSQK